jgi:hypothetical protein
MGIFENFQKWAEDRFDGDIVVKGNEIVLNSIFADDTKYHLWCSPSGGKTERKNGVFHCFKTDKKGSLPKLIQIVDKCSFEKALCVLHGRSTISELEDKLFEFFENIDENQDVKISKPAKVQLVLPEGSCLISSLPKNNFWRNLAVDYLAKRKIPTDGLYICKTAPYKARIIIPYYDSSGDLFYWNGRHVGNSRIRYLGPPKEVGVGKSDVLFFAGGNWAEKNEEIYLCEGEFDALSLFYSGLNGVACGGKNLSEKQMNLIKDYKIVICLDNDKAGLGGMTAMTDMINKNIESKNLKERLMFVSPHKSYKDWNEMFIKEGPSVMKNYVLATRKNLDFQAPMGMGGDYFRIKGM